MIQRLSRSRTPLFGLLLLGAAWLGAGCQMRFSEASWQQRVRGNTVGLERLEQARIDEAYEQPAVDWRRFRGVAIERVALAGEVETGMLRRADRHLEVPRRRLEQRLEEQLVAWLRPAGADVLRLRVLVTELVPNRAPFDERNAVPGSVRTATGIGSAAAQFELRDAAGELLLVWVDRQRGNPLRADQGLRPDWQDAEDAFARWGMLAVIRKA